MNRNVLVLGALVAIGVGAYVLFSGGSGGGNKASDGATVAAPPTKAAAVAQGGRVAKPSRGVTAADPESSAAARERKAREAARPELPPAVENALVEVDEALDDLEETDLNASAEVLEAKTTAARRALANFEEAADPDDLEQKRIHDDAIKRMGVRLRAFASKDARPSDGN